MAITWQISYKEHFLLYNKNNIPALRKRKTLTIASFTWEEKYPRVSMQISYKSFVGVVVES